MGRGVLVGARLGREQGLGKACRHVFVLGEHALEQAQRLVELGGLDEQRREVDDAHQGRRTEIVGRVAELARAKARLEPLVGTEHERHAAHETKQRRIALVVRRRPGLHFGAEPREQRAIGVEVVEHHAAVRSQRAARGVTCGLPSLFDLGQHRERRRRLERLGSRVDEASERVDVGQPIAVVVGEGHGRLGVHAREPPRVTSHEPARRGARKGVVFCHQQLAGHVERALFATWHRLVHRELHADRGQELLKRIVRDPVLLHRLGKRQQERLKARVLEHRSERAERLLQRAIALAVADPLESGEGLGVGPKRVHQLGHRARGERQRLARQVEERNQVLHETRQLVVRERVIGEDGIERAHQARAISAQGLEPRGLDGGLLVSLADLTIDRTAHVVREVAARHVPAEHEVDLGAKRAFLDLGQRLGRVRARR